MLLGFLDLLLAQAQQPENGGPPSWATWVPLVLMVVVFWFLIMVPQRRQQKQKMAQIASLKKNDKIINSGGIIGIVDVIKENEDEVILRGGLRITKGSIERVLPQDDAAKS